MAFGETEDNYLIDKSEEDYYNWMHLQLESHFIENLTCTGCTITFQSEAELQSHIPQCTSRSDETQPMLACFYPNCTYKSSRKDDLRKHSMIHNSERKFACPYCPYRALHKHHLTNHLTRHTGEKPHACPHCPFRTARKSYLEFHIKRHFQPKSNY